MDKKNVSSWSSETGDSAILDTLALVADQVELFDGMVASIHDFGLALANNL